MDYPKEQLPLNQPTTRTNRIVAQLVNRGLSKSLAHYLCKRHYQDIDFPTDFPTEQYHADAWVPYKELDTNILTLVKALNQFNGIATQHSCGGHDSPKPYQDQAGTWSVGFQVEMSLNGWSAIEFIAWLIDDYRQWRIDREVAHWVRLEAFSPPLVLNNPGTSLHFDLHGWNNEDPQELSQFINRMREKFYNEHYTLYKTIKRLP